MTLRIIETRWYLAYQDGPMDDITYDTEEEAKTARRKLPKFEQRSVCVMSRDYDRSQ